MFYIPMKIYLNEHSVPSQPADNLNYPLHFNSLFRFQIWNKGNFSTQKQTAENHPFPLYKDLNPNLQQEKRPFLPLKHQKSSRCTSHKFIILTFFFFLQILAKSDFFFFFIHVWYFSLEISNFKMSEVLVS